MHGPRTRADQYGARLYRDHKAPRNLDKASVAAFLGAGCHLISSIYFKLSANIWEHYENQTIAKSRPNHMNDPNRQIYEGNIKGPRLREG